MRQHTNRASYSTRGVESCAAWWASAGTHAGAQKAHRTHRMHRARTCASSSAIRCRAFAFADAGIGARSTVLGAVRSGHFARRRVRADSEFVVILSQHWRAAETSCRRRCRARRPTPADSRYWGRSAPPFCPSEVCHLRPRRASSAPQDRSWRPACGGASAEGSCRRRCRAPRPTPAGFPYWGRSKAPFCLSKACHLRPRRAASAPGGK